MAVLFKRRSLNRYFKSWEFKKNRLIWSLNSRSYKKSNVLTTTQANGVTNDIIRKATWDIKKGMGRLR